MATQELLTAKEMAERIRVKPATLRKWSRRGRIPRLELSPKVIRFDPNDVLAAISAKCLKGGRS